MSRAKDNASARILSANAILFLQLYVMNHA
jgi:hypothetical protein